MSEYEEIAEAEEPVVVEHVTVVEEPGSAGEMLRFFALIIVLVVVVVVVAVTRPLIFGRIVPAVMGEGIVVPTTEPPVTDGVEEPETSPNEAERADEETTPAENTADEAQSSASDGEEMAEEDEAAAQEGTTNESDAGETAENETATATHTIKQGETLQTIAAQYGITLQELIAANSLPNPDYIRIGDELTIPSARDN